MDRQGRLRCGNPMLRLMCSTFKCLAERGSAPRISVRHRTDPASRMNKRLSVSLSLRRSAWNGTPECGKLIDGEGAKPSPPIRKQFGTDLVPKPKETDHAPVGRLSVPLHTRSSSGGSQVHFGNVSITRDFADEHGVEHLGIAR